ncbi:MAG: translation initiation factor IF-2 [Candidatus Spechtbacterales bacterium]
MAKTTTKTKKELVQTRPPVVVILGHVDHGKTSILDYIRKTKVAEGESGGITQHTGAYQVEQNDKTITFLDTPGHEAFSAMRSRGAQVADIAVLVVAADDGVKPQTKEAIAHIKSAGIPFIVALNKIDKPDAESSRVKTQLLEEEVLLEGFGGDVPNVEVSAKSGQGIDDLLDMINLVAELEELTADANANLELVVIEAQMEKARGAVATLLVQRGTVERGDIIAGTTTWAKVRGMEDFLGTAMDVAGPATPVVLFGFNAVPQVGERFVEVSSVKEAETRVANAENVEPNAFVREEEGQKVVNLIVNTDVHGTMEAVRDIIAAMDSEEVKLRVLQERVGEITDSDVRLAKSGSALIVGFRVHPNRIAEQLVRQHEVPIVTFDTIYDLKEGVRDAVHQLLDPIYEDVLVGELKVLQIFRTEPTRMIVGGRIISGELTPNLDVRVMRDGEEIGTGKLSELRTGQQKAERAGEGSEVGIRFIGETRVVEGDIIVAGRREKKIPGLR